MSSERQTSSFDSLTPLEIRIMELCLRNETEWRAKLRAQVPSLVIQERIAFPDGFKIKFEELWSTKPVTIPRNPDGTPVRDYPPTVYAKLLRPPGGLATFIVWVGRNGAITSFDGHSMVGDSWPSDLEGAIGPFCNERGEVLE